MTSCYKTRKLIKRSSLWMCIWGIESENRRMPTTPRATSEGRVPTRGQMEDRQSDPSPRLSHPRPLGSNTHSPLSIVRIMWLMRAPLSINKWWRRSSSNHVVVSLNCRGILMKMIYRDCQANCSLDLRYRGRLKVVSDRNSIQGRIFRSSKRLFSLN